MARLAKALSLAATITVIGVVPAAADPGSLHVRSHGRSVNATPGSWCWTETGEGVGVCADFAYPLPTHGRLAVGGSDRVRILTEKPARKVDVRLVRTHGQDVGSLLWHGRAKRSGSSGLKWRIRLPQDLAGATILDVFVRYPQGDGDFWAGLKQQ